MKEASIPSGSSDAIRQELLEQQVLTLLATLLDGGKDPVTTEVGSSCRHQWLAV